MPEQESTSAEEVPAGGFEGRSEAATASAPRFTPAGESIAARYAARQRARRRQLLGLMVRLVLISGLMLWLAWRLMPLLGPPTARRAVPGTVTIAEPDGAPVAPATAPVAEPDGAPVAPATAPVAEPDGAPVAPAR